MHIAIPAIRFYQGSRVMYISAARAGEVVGITQTPEQWDPLAEQPHGNRPVDRAHVAGFVEYLEREPNPIVGALVLYCQPGDISFSPATGDEAEGIVPGTLHLRPGVTYDIGDGLHRQQGEAKILQRQAHDPDDPILQRVLALGQPFILVPEADGRRRAQDFADLQVNVKPATGSLGMSMNRRLPFNKFMIDEVVQHPELKLFGGGNRIDFLSESPGKLSAKWASFKAVRYMTGTLLIGVAERGADRWNRAAAAAIEGERHDPALASAVGFFKGLQLFTPIAEVIAGERTMSELREGTLLASSRVLYALAFSCHLATTTTGISVDEAMARLVECVDLSRPQREISPEEPLSVDEPGGYFAGSLIDSSSGSINSGRNKWEAAGRLLHQSIAGDKEPVPAE